MSRLPSAAIGCLAAVLIVGCASTPAPQAGSAAAEPVAHEYRTGSIMAQREKHVATEEDRQRAQEIANEIRRTPGSVPASR